MLATCGDLISTEFGGSADPAIFTADPREAHGGWFRKHMFRWFRKIVSVRDASQGFNGVLIWLDSDCYLKSAMSKNVLAEAFGGADVFYFKGERPYTETGVVGYDLSSPYTHRLIDDMMTFYSSRAFEMHPRWDDCYAFDWVRRRVRGLCGRDIAGPMNGFWDVIRTSQLGVVVEHDKGLHGRITRLYE
jgi:hypothetical protein